MPEQTTQLDTLIEELAMAQSEDSSRQSLLRKWLFLVDEDKLPQASPVVLDAIKWYTERMDLLQHALESLHALKAHNYPRSTSLSGSAEVINELRDALALMQTVAHAFSEIPSAELVISEQTPAD